MKKIISLSIIFICLSSSLFSQDQFIEVIVSDTLHLKAESVSFKIIEYNVHKRQKKILDTIDLEQLLSENNIIPDVVLKDQKTINPDLLTTITFINKLDVEKFNKIEKLLSINNGLILMITEHHHKDVERYHQKLNTILLEKSSIKANSLASSANMKIGKLISITEEPYVIPTNTIPNLNKNAGWHTYLGGGIYDSIITGSEVQLLERKLRVKYQLID